MGAGNLSSYPHAYIASSTLSPLPSPQAHCFGYCLLWLSMASSNYCSSGLFLGIVSQSDGYFSPSVATICSIHHLKELGGNCLIEREDESAVATLSVAGVLLCRIL